MIGIIKSIKKIIDISKEEQISVDSKVEIITNKEVTVDGCKGILEYENDFIKVKIGKGIVAISGSKLKAFAYIDETLIIKGIIKNVEYIM